MRTIPGGVFELAEGELGLGLGAVAGHDLGDRPVVAVGDQDTFAEDLGFQVVAGRFVDVVGEPVLGWALAGESQVMTRRVQGSRVIWVISVSTLSRGRRVWPRARVSASAESFALALARV